jgi:hypothetical protein
MIDELQPVAQHTSVRRRTRQQRLPKNVWLFLCAVIVVSTTTTTTLLWCWTGGTTTFVVDALLLSPPLSSYSSRPRPMAISSIPLIRQQQQSLLPTTTTTTTTMARTAAIAATVLRATTSNNNNDNDNDNDNKKKEKKKKLGRTSGVYVRPSGAIERGSGFFVPGLEGSKIKVVIGTVLLTGTAANHWFGFMPHDFSFSEGMAVGFSLLLLFQFAIEYVKESLPLPSSSSSSSSSSKNGNTSSLSAVVAKTTNTVDTISSSSSSAVLNQQWSENNEDSSDDGTIRNDEYRTKVQWAAASYLSMTPSTQIMLLNNHNNNNNNDNDNSSSKNGGTGTVLYRLGRGEGGGEGGERSSTQNNAAAGVESALKELRQSKGGRIALPLTHPAVQALLLFTDNNDNDIDIDIGIGGSSSSTSIRTVILQRITDDSCWMVGSDQLLAGYTSGDLKWLGQLAKYVAV